MSEQQEGATRPIMRVDELIDTLADKLEGLVEEAAEIYHLEVGDIINMLSNELKARLMP